MFFHYSLFLHSDTVKIYHLTRKTYQANDIFPILKDSTNQTHRSLFEVFGAVRSPDALQIAMGLGRWTTGDLFPTLQCARDIFDARCTTEQHL